MSVSPPTHPSRRATICLLSDGARPEHFQHCFWSVLNHTPRDRIELRLGFTRSAYSLYYALGVLCADNTTPVFQQLPGNSEHFYWTGIGGLPVRAWHSPQSLPQDEMLRLLWHDVPLETDYVVCLDEGRSVEAGWWEALAPILDRGVDYLGQPIWRDYPLAEAQQVQNHPCFRGVPFARREGRIGVSFMTGGFLVVRSQRLREANFPLARWVGKGEQSSGLTCDVVLGEIARQLGWSQAVLGQDLPGIT